MLRGYIVDITVSVLGWVSRHYHVRTIHNEHDKPPVEIVIDPIDASYTDIEAVPPKP